MAQWVMILVLTIGAVSATAFEPAKTESTYTTSKVSRTLGLTEKARAERALEQLQKLNTSTPITEAKENNSVIKSLNQIISSKTLTIEQLQQALDTARTISENVPSENSIKELITQLERKLHAQETSEIITPIQNFDAQNKASYTKQTVNKVVTAAEKALSAKTLDLDSLNSINDTLNIMLDEAHIKLLTVDQRVALREIPEKIALIIVINTKSLS